MIANPLTPTKPDDTSVITAGNGAPVATTEMFGGKNLSDVSGPNGINNPDAGDFAFVAGSTAAAGWAGTDRGAGRMGEFKDTAANKVEGARDAATKDVADAKEWRAAEKAGTTQSLVDDKSKEAAKNTPRSEYGDDATRKGEKAAQRIKAEERAKGVAARDYGPKSARAFHTAAQKQVAKNVAGDVAEQGAKLAAKKAGMMAAKQAGLRVAAMAVGAAIPGPGWLIAGGVLIGSILLDGDMRNMISGIFSSGMDANQPPAPPTTNWLPASDDNRMNDIAPADKRLTELNNGVTNIESDPNKLWHLQESQVPGLTTMSGAVSQLNDAGKNTATTANDYINALNSAPDSWGESFQKGRADIAQNVGQFAEKAGTPVATALSSAATASDATYQELREGNAKARQQLADSQGRFLGFVGGGSGTEGLGNNLPSIEAKVRDVQAATQAVHRAGEDWMVRPTQTTSPTQPDVAARPTPVVPTPQVPPAWRQAPAPTQITPKSAVPETKVSSTPTPKPTTPAAAPKKDTPTVPQTPNLGSANPFGGGGSNPFGGGGSQQGQKPLSDIMSNLPSAPKETKPKDTDPFNEKSKESDIKGKDPKKDEKDKEEKKPEDKKGDEKKPEDKKPGDEKKPEDHKPAAEAVAPAPKPAPNGATAPVGPSTTVEIGGKPVDFKDPKLAEMVRNVMAAEDGAPSTVRAAAERAGIEIPPAGQDIGKPADPNNLKPGNVISSADGKTYIYLGEDQVLGEDKKTHPLSKVSVFDGPNDGPFALNTGTPADGQQPAAGTPAPGQGQQPQAGTPGAPAAPAAPAAGTDQAQQPGQPAAPAAPAQPSGTPAPQPPAGTPVPGQGSATFPTTPEAPIGMGAHQGGDQSGSGVAPAAPAPSSVNAPADPKPQSNPTVPPGASAASPAGPGSAPVDPSTITP